MLPKNQRDVTLQLDVSAPAPGLLVTMDGLADALRADGHIEGGDAIAERYGVTGTPGLFIVDDKGRAVLDLRDVMAAAAKDPEVEKLNNRLKAARRGPYWAARIREALDTLYR